MTFLRDEENVFWGEKCIGEGRSENCVRFAQEHYKVGLSSIRAEQRTPERIDLMAVIHYLDHLAKPLEFLRMASEAAQHLLLVCHRDTEDHQGVIQHNTVFNRQVLDFVADRLQLEILGECACPEDADDENFIILLRMPARTPHDRGQAELDRA